MYIYVRPFKAEDIKKFKPIEPIVTDEVMPIADLIEKSGLAVTGLINGEVVCCGGVHPVNKEQGEAWLRISRKCRKYKFATLRWIFAGLKIVEETYPFNQLNATVRLDCPKMVKLIETLGFKLVQYAEEKKVKYGIYVKRVKE